MGNQADYVVAMVIGVLYNCDYLNNHLSNDLRTSFNRIFSSNYRGFQPLILEMRGLQNRQDKVAAANFTSISTGEWRLLCGGYP
jgi:hypothetical protein